MRNIALLEWGSGLSHFRCLKQKGTEQKGLFAGPASLFYIQPRELIKAPLRGCSLGCPMSCFPHLCRLGHDGWMVARRRAQVRHFCDMQKTWSAAQVLPPFLSTMQEAQAIALPQAA